MKKIFSLMALVLTFNVSANCSVFIPVKEFVHAGIPIRFDFYSILDKKNYTEVYSEEASDYTLLVSGTEIEGRFFQHAVGEYKLSDQQGREVLKVSQSSRCLTQFCSVGDFVKSFNKGHRKLDRSLQACE